MHGGAETRIDSSIDARFRSTVSADPTAVALIIDGEEITRSTLSDWADAIGARLVEVGLEPGEVVGVHLERSGAFVATCLGVMRAGGLYLPLEPSSPPERLAVMAEDSGPRHVVSERALPDLDGLRGATVVSPAPGEAHAVRWPAVAPADEAFLVYTSGSTGRPKGVPLSHGAVMNRLEWQWRRFPFEPDEVAIQKTTSNFVDHAAELFAPLLAGVPVVIGSEQDTTDLWRLVSLIERYQVRRTVLVPSVAGALLDSIPDAATRLSSLRWLTVSGERLLAPVAERILEALPGIELINIYGMSEAMADVTFHVSTIDTASSAPLIGTAIDGLQIAVIDSTGATCPPGEAGEIRVRGAGLSSGYWRQPDLTAERFGTDDDGEPGLERWFATGDLGRLDEEGRLEYHGRADDQVKVRGVRIELGDVEAALLRLDGVTEAAVVAVDRAGSTVLTGFVETAGEPFDVAAARTSLGDVLLGPAVPTSINAVDSLPRLASGKVDRRTLAEQATARADGPVADHPMTKLWASIPELDVHHPDDDFFDSGGHSLVAVRLVAEIVTEYGVELGLDSLAAAPTPRLMAALVAEGGERTFRHRVTWFPPAVPGPTVHLVHGNGGNVLNFRPIAAALAPDVHVECYQARGVDGLEPPHGSVDEMADAYLAEMPSSDGPPLLIGGYSGGGIIALELAARMVAGGRPVGGVVLLDTRHPQTQHRRSTLREKLIVLGAGPRELVDRARSRIDDARRRDALRAARRSAARDGVVPLDHVDVHLEAELGAATNIHVVRDAGVPVTLLRAETIDESMRHIGDRNGWTDEFADFDMQIVPGGHADLLDHEHLDVLVGHLRRLAVELAD